MSDNCFGPIGAGGHLPSSCCVSSDLPFTMGRVSQQCPYLGCYSKKCLFNHSNHCHTATWSEGCEPSWVVGMYPSRIDFFLLSTEFFWFPKRSQGSECLLCQLGTGETARHQQRQRRTCAFKLLGMAFSGTATLPEPVSLLERGTLQIASVLPDLCSRESLAWSRRLQVMS